jgi:hypothetical protein
MEQENLPWRASDERRLRSFATLPGQLLVRNPNGQRLAIDAAKPDIEGHGQLATLGQV